MVSHAQAVLARGRDRTNTVTTALSEHLTLEINNNIHPKAIHSNGIIKSGYHLPNR